MGTKCPMFFSSSYIIKFCGLHCSFVFSHTTTKPFSNSSLRKPHTTHQLPLLTPSLSCEHGVPTQHFHNPLNNAHVRRLPLSILSAFINVHDRTPQFTPISQHTYNLHLKPLPPCVGVNLPFKGQPITIVLIKHLIHLIQIN